MTMESSPRTEYWDAEAQAYDSLYSTQWSAAEDASVVALLRGLHLSGPTVLDLCCGTGLGLRLLQQAGVSPDYHGVDFSAKMLRHFWTMPCPAIQPRLLELYQVDLQLSDPPRVDPDIILSTFSGLSFVADLARTLAPLLRNQRPGGVAVLMLLNRFSIGQLLHGHFNSTLSYKTRSSLSKASTTAFLGNAVLAERLLRRSGYEIDRCGDGLLSGWLEHPSLTALNARTVTHCGRFAHTRILVARKARHARV